MELEILRNLYKCQKLGNKKYIFVVFFLFFAPFVFAGKIYYVANDEVGTHSHNWPNFSVCIGSISEVESGVFAECYARASSGFAEDSLFGPRVWSKRGLNYGAFREGMMWIPYEIKYVNGSQPTTYSSETVSYRAKSCPSEGCYLLSLEKETEPPKLCVGNPIDPVNGEKRQTEIDINGAINFQRHYNSHNYINDYGKPWRHSFDKFIAYFPSQPYPHEDSVRSEPYYSREDACIEGWADIRVKPEFLWASTAVATYDTISMICTIKKENDVIFSLKPIGTNDLFLNVKDIVKLDLADGRSLKFERDSGARWRPLGGHAGHLLKLDDGRWKYTANGVVEIYSSSGKLISIEYSNKVYLDFTYDEIGKLKFINSNRNQQLQLKYTNNLLSEVIAADGKVIKYNYDVSNRLVSVIYPNAASRLYHYEDASFPYALTGITDERNKRYATWAYDAQGRAISSEHAGGAEKTLLSFNADGSTTVINSLNKQTIYRFAQIAGARRVVKVEGQPTTNCLGANQDYTYTNEGWLASKTDWKGIKTTYQYNTLGQETSRTEAFGTTEARTITTEWHPSLYVKTKVTEPGKETVFNYDANGRLLNQSTTALSN